MKKIKRVLQKIHWKLIDINNERVNKQFDDYKFLYDLCCERDEYSETGRALNLNKYSRLMKMVKRKYK